MTSRPAFSMRTLIAVVVGGMLGVGLRAAIVLPLGATASAVAVLAAVTVAVNVIGSGLLGVVVGSVADRRPIVRAFLGTGVLGGFTTYSSFAVHTVQVSMDAGLLWSLCLVGGSIVGGVLAAAGGLVVGRRLAGRREHAGRIEPEAAE